MKRWMRWMALLLTVAMLLPAAGLAETAVVKGGWLRLRAEPSFDAATITSYYTGTCVTVNGVIGRWYQVTTPDKRDGYMYGDYLTLGAAPSVGGATVTSKNGLPVRLRSGPGTGYGVIAKYSVGTKVTILSRGTYWHYVRIGGKTGYMMAEFIFDGTAPVTPDPVKPDPGAGYTAWVTSNNGKAVNLRPAPSKNNTPIGSYRVGTQVTVLEHGKTWDYIRVGTRTGYMMTEFLTTRQSAAVVTGAVIGNKTPSVGDKLTVTVLPEGATVTYQWLNESGVLLSTAASYVVTAEDVGRKLRVLVSGTGATTGVVTSGYTAPVKALPSPTAAPAPTTAPTGKPTEEPHEDHKAISGSVVIPGAVKVGVTIVPNVNVNATDLTYQWYQNGVLVATGATLTPTDAMAGSTIKLYVIGKGYTGEVKSEGCVVIADVTTPTDL